MCVCVCVSVSKWRPRGTELEKAVCFIRRLHPNDAKPVRTVSKTVMDSDFGASGKGELGSASPMMCEL